MRDFLHKNTFGLEGGEGLLRVEGTCCKTCWLGKGSFPDTASLLPDLLYLRCLMGDTVGVTSMMTLLAPTAGFSTSCCSGKVTETMGVDVIEGMNSK